MQITLQVQIDNRVVTEQITMPESYRGDYRRAVQEIAARIELSTFGPQMYEGNSFDEQLKPQGP